MKLGIHADRSQAAAIKSLCGDELAHGLAGLAKFDRRLAGHCLAGTRNALNEELSVPFRQDRFLAAKPNTHLVNVGTQPRDVGGTDRLLRATGISSGVDISIRGQEVASPNDARDQYDVCDSLQLRDLVYVRRESPVLITPYVVEARGIEPIKTRFKNIRDSRCYSVFSNVFSRVDVR